MAVAPAIVATSVGLTSNNNSRNQAAVTTGEREADGWRRLRQGAEAVAKHHRESTVTCVAPEAAADADLTRALRNRRVQHP